MSEQLQVLTTIATRFTEAGIPYMVTGSIASSHYAEPRFTRDIDIVVEMTQRDVPRVVQLLDDEFHVDEEAIGRAVARRGLVNVFHRQSFVKVDLIVRKETAYRREEFARRRVANIGNVSVAIVSPEDLILSKLVWIQESGSDVQRRDVARLVQSVEALDRAYIERWAEELSVASLWREIVGSDR